MAVSVDENGTKRSITVSSSCRSRTTTFARKQSSPVTRSASMASGVSTSICANLLTSPGRAIEIAVRHIAAPEDDQAGFQLLFVDDKRHATLHCAESVQVRGDGARKSITVQVLCSELCHILLGDSSYLLESCHPDHPRKSTVRRRCFCEDQSAPNSRTPGRAGTPCATRPARRANSPPC